MKKQTFRVQLSVGLGVLAACFVLSTLTRQGIFINIGWFLYGALFAFHPVWPEQFDGVDQVRMKRGLRIAGAVVMVLAVITRFSF